MNSDPCSYIDYEGGDH